MGSFESLSESEREFVFLCESRQIVFALSRLQIAPELQRRSCVLIVSVVVPSFLNVIAEGVLQSKYLTN